MVLLERDKGLFERGASQMIYCNFREVTVKSVIVPSRTHFEQQTAQ